MDKGVLIAIGISAISPILKSIFDFFLEKYKNRLSNYKYTQSLISLGATVNHDFLGKI